MPKQDDPTTGGGLLSKVVKFVRNSSSTWTEGEGEDGRESSYSKQMLKEMIERKRRNDFVRKREFDMLRKLRRSEVMAGHDPGARPSFFQSSMPSRPDDRASTLKKIDEIEAQMSMQWWKSKHGDANARAHAGSSTNFPLNSQLPPGASEPPVPQGHSYSRTAPQPLSTALPDDAPTAPEPLLDFGDIRGGDRAHAPTEPLPLEARAAHGLPPAPSARPQAPAAARPPAPAFGAAPAPAAPAAPVATPLQRPAMGSFAAAAPDSHAASGFSHSKVFAIDVEEFAHDPELEEAAIRFANGDDAGAEAGLREVLAAGGPRADHDETWLTLFDLYRAIGQQERFEAAAIEFAGRFGRSAPQWVSLPEAVGRMGGAGKPVAAPAADRIDWTAPSSIGTQTVAALSAALARAPQPWKLSWAKLSGIEAGALEPLARLFGQWAAQPVQIRFIGAEVLERVLRDATPSGDKSVPPAWWKLRMEALRVMHRPDEFELVALDYCVTYEVSPPSWDGARCEFKALLADGSVAASGQSIVGDAFHDSVGTNLSSYHDTATAGLSSQTAHVATVELAGQILGDAHETMDLLEGRLHGADVMVISCARLIRIDFSAAGSLLNWASQRQLEGRQLQFVDVHRLVAAFFNVIGISAHARVIARRD